MTREPQYREQIDLLLGTVSPEKVDNLCHLITEKKISPSSTAVDFKMHTTLTSNQIRVVQELLQIMPDAKILPFCIKTIQEIHNMKKQGNTRLVWTSPIFDQRSNNTWDTMLSMIRSAKKSILIIGYALWEAGDIIDELSKASSNGCEIKFILENGKKYKKIILNNWHSSRRPQIFSYSTKKANSLLHAKAIISDNTEILITSANLTKNAIESNVELGIFHDDKNLSKQVTEMFDALIAEGYAKEV